eukprot:gene3407-6766_t
MSPSRSASGVGVGVGGSVASTDGKADSSRPITNKIKLEKHVKASVWMQPDNPFNLKDLLLALEVLAMKDKYVVKLKEVLDSVVRDVPTGSFPVSIRVPLILGVNAVVAFGKIQVDKDYVPPTPPTATASAVVVEETTTTTTSCREEVNWAYCALFDIPSDYVYKDADEN